MFPIEESRVHYHRVAQSSTQLFILLRPIGWVTEIPGDLLMVELKLSPLNDFRILRQLDPIHKKGL